MRCYFHLRSEWDEILDDEGIEVADLESAKAEALMALCELHDETCSTKDWEGWHLSIVCSQGTLLHAFPLVQALH